MAWGDLLEAIQVHQEIGEENEELKAEVQDLAPLIKVCDSLREKIDRLEEENLYLRHGLTEKKNFGATCLCLLLAVVHRMEFSTVGDWLEE